MSAVDETVMPGMLADDGQLGFVVARPLRRGAKLALRRWLGFLVRAATVVIPVAAVVVVARDKPVGVEVLVLSAVWFVAPGARRHAPWLRHLSRRLPLPAVWGTGLGLLGASIVGFWIPALGLTPSQLLLMGIATLTATVALELMLGGSLSRPSRLVVVGDVTAGAAVAGELRVQGVTKFELVRVVDTGPDADGITYDAVSDADLIVMAGGQAATVQSVLDAGGGGVRVIDLHGFFEHAFGRIPLAGLSPLWFTAVLHLYQRGYSRVTKRVFDCIVAIVLLIALGPLLAIAAIAIRLSSGSPILYRQVRLGERGKTFQMLKLRTMIDGAEADGEARWAEKEDRRVTRFGRLLRQSRIDELPQLWNVLRGEMSVVGPRPERPEFLDLLAQEIPFWSRRQLVKPGITGWAQVSAGYASDVDGAERKLSYDLYYLKHRSLALDLAIMAKTVGVAVRGFGAR
jgi:exopolysaccharide biosynthesis polyprenyl glycosylphosphotransferase